MNPILLHQKIISWTRAFFINRGFEEFNVPLLHPSLPLEPNLYSFETIHHSLQSKNRLYLSTSPESSLKKNIAKTRLSKVFSISHSFRDREGESPIHQQEFLMVEWYRLNADYNQIMKDSQNLILFTKKKIDSYLKRPLSASFRFKSQNIDLSVPWPKLSLIDLFDKYSRIDLLSVLDNNALFDIAQKRKYALFSNTRWEEIFNQIYLNDIFPNLPFSPFFLTDFPSRISPLARKNKNNTHISDRFELIIAKIELGNGNAENTDSDAIHKSFSKEQEFRQKEKIISPTIDDNFISALKSLSSHTFSGMGLGIDRLSMLLQNINHIKDLYIR